MAWVDYLGKIPLPPHLGIGIDLAGSLALICTIRIFWQLVQASTGVGAENLGVAELLLGVRAASLIVVQGSLELPLVVVGGDLAVVVHASSHLMSWLKALVQGAGIHVLGRSGSLVTAVLDLVGTRI